MVVFTCNHCGDSLKKPSVEKHYQFTCRTTKSLTCVDCLKDFIGEEYATHTRCLTEEERYAAKGSMVNVVHKGEIKQESWLEMIKSILDKQPNVKPSHRNLLNKISNYNNVPRKKVKFMNFIMSSSGGRANRKEVEEVWDIIETYKNSQKGNGNTQTTQKNEASIKEMKVENVKRKALDTDSDIPNKKNKLDDGLTIEETDTVKFSFQEKIVSILNAKGCISLKKLQKKVLNAYLKHSGENKVTPKMIKKFNKKLSKVQNIELTDENVTLLENKEC
ncbi:unnamed protein product [Acanthoscelides obtectus]|uniref:Cell growth-regulating nucleolar protein n=1 Tax=Acanthoscelides obtectus TaxID=200917 RepID=A0A9P0K3W7_ACAOB|nr:unnamed protein product [Acanthoscelides obtectus]CAK1648035.1 Cell growth-regulating nucleolar protein [Acanthoscelides obtectus]